MFSRRARPTEDAHERDRERVARARADLRRLAQQSEKILGAEMGQGALGDDAVEYWGRRIGRAAGIVAAAGLAWYLFVTYL